MKNLVVVVLMLAFVLTSCSPQKPQTEETTEPANELAGVWEMSYSKYVYPDTTIITSGSANASIKILTSTHFAFGFQDTDSTILAGGGTYQYEGETYSEIIEYHTVTELVGKTIDFNIRLEEDKWYHSGTLILDGEEVTMEETWERVE